MSKTSMNNSSIIINPDTSDTSFDEDKTITRVRSLKEEYTENYSDSSDQPVKVTLILVVHRQRTIYVDASRKPWKI